MSGPQVLQQSLVHCSVVSRLRQTQCPGHRRHEELGVGEGGKLNEGRPDGELGRQLCCHLQGQPRFADASRPGEGDQAHVIPLQQGQRLGEFLFAINQPAARQRQRGQPGVGRRRGCTREALGQQLCQVVGDALTQLLRGGELLVGGDLLAADAVQQGL